MQIQKIYKIIGKNNERFAYLTEQVLENNKNITELRKIIDNLQTQINNNIIVSEKDFEVTEVVTSNSKKKAVKKV